MILVVWAKATLTDLHKIRSYISEFSPYATRDMAKPLSKMALLRFHFVAGLFPTDDFAR